MTVIALTAGLGLGGLAPQVSAATERECNAEDNTGGMGGQHVECTFRCTEGDLLTVEVEAMDGDADVSGTADCGGTSAHCTGDRTCVGTDGPARRAQDGGECEGNSNEFWDSGLYVECRADAAACSKAGCILDPPPNVGEPEIPNPKDLEIPPGDDEGGDEDDGGVKPICFQVEGPHVTGFVETEEFCVESSFASSAFILSRDGSAVGLLCADSCLPVIPTPTAAGAGWSVGPSSEPGVTDVTLLAELVDRIG
jgi:hypothetical protein